MAKSMQEGKMMELEVIVKYNQKVSESKIFLKRCGYTIMSNEDLLLNERKISTCIGLMMILSFVLGIAICKLVGTL